ncbi:MAG TPA: hypothetical protein VJJ21_01695 [Candidatus Nanoarchaeia archaeon]|nr:hypothetical protein [Candidatus Nanoarchaeia archaeon]
MKEVNIETAVDSLVKLVNDKKIIALDEAAKILGVPENIVNEWASFLEEDKIMKIDYKLTKPFLKAAEDTVKIAQDFEDITSERENMIRKLSYMLTAIKRRELKPSMQIKTIEDVKKILNSKDRAKDDVLSAQRFVLEKGITDLINILNSIKDIKKLRDISKQFEELDKKRAIFEKV